MVQRVCPYKAVIDTEGKYIFPNYLISWLNFVCITPSTIHPDRWVFSYRPHLHCVTQKEYQKAYTELAQIHLEDMNEPSFNPGLFSMWLQEQKEERQEKQSK